MHALTIQKRTLLNAGVRVAEGNTRKSCFETNHDIHWGWGTFYSKDLTMIHIRALINSLQMTETVVNDAKPLTVCAPKLLFFDYVCVCRNCVHCYTCTR